ncbi:uncharacterized protein LOC106471062 [Limulus polyphemus]|uniref:Uncharacterized protein LOC106471062 n=1 Tax=Limulus polyphemus TaxID=6850 RepID=A0ABM1THN9_LIMPO|nr:uncharacterized protein LOC106471062 [Limulus polyphemus]
MLLLCALIHLLAVTVSNGLRILYLDVPQSVGSRQEVRLGCRYDLEKDSLYSVKWYKDDLEFFRFVPKENPQRQFFPLDGINVDFTRSNKDVVLIEDVQMATGGMYRCEVSADAPSFRTVSTEKMMVVKADTGGGVRRHCENNTVLILFLLILLFGIGITRIN